MHTMLARMPIPERSRRDGEGRFVYVAALLALLAASVDNAIPLLNGSALATLMNVFRLVSINAELEYKCQSSVAFETFEDGISAACALKRANKMLLSAVRSQVSKSWHTNAVLRSN
jgi:hypothetical protein